MFFKFLFLLALCICMPARASAIEAAESLESSRDATEGLFNQSAAFSSIASPKALRGESGESLTAVISNYLTCSVASDSCSSSNFVCCSALADVLVTPTGNAPKFTCRPAITDNGGMYSAI